MGLILFGLVEDFVPSAGVEPVSELPMSVAQVAGDEILDRPGPVTNGILRPGDDQERLCRMVWTR